jgi:hypothetical protein
VKDPAMLQCSARQARPGRLQGRKDSMKHVAASRALSTQINSAEAFETQLKRIKNQRSSRVLTKLPPFQ